MTDPVKITIDGIDIYANPGTTVLDAALENGIYIPHLCHHPDLEPVGACRLCGVEINGERMTMSCLTPVQESMQVCTESPTINATRQIAMELLIANHHMDCLACAAALDCELLRIANYIGIDETRLARLSRPSVLLPVDDSNPFFRFDPNKCIVCGICVRTCEEIQGVRALDFIHRGFDTVIGTFGNQPFAESVCESCGECVVRCPVGALTPKHYELPVREVQTTCVYCGVGCGIYLGIKGNRIVSVRGDRERPSNMGQLCVKGRYGFKFISHPARLTTPLIKRNGTFEEATWDEALDLVVEKFSQYKGDSFASFASAKCTNEENYLIQKFTRAVMGTNNVDHCARL
jgi:formate dehydrogenase major subunit